MNLGKSQPHELLLDDVCLSRSAVRRSRANLRRTANWSTDSDSTATDWLADALADEHVDDRLKLCHLTAGVLLKHSISPQFALIRLSSSLIELNLIK